MGRQTGLVEDLRLEGLCEETEFLGVKRSLTHSVMCKQRASMGMLEGWVAKLLPPPQLCFGLGLARKTFKSPLSYRMKLVVTVTCKILMLRSCRSFRCVESQQISGLIPDWMDPPNTHTSHTHTSCKHPAPKTEALRSILCSGLNHLWLQTSHHQPLLTAQKHESSLLSTFGSPTE